MKRNILVLILISLLITSCSKENTLPVEPLPESSTVKAIVVNEGQFGYGTSSLTALYSDGEVKQDVFRTINNRTMGDVAQSLKVINNLYYVPLNNSRKIEVIEPRTFKSVKTIPIPLDAIPMYAEQISDNLIAVTDQKGPSQLIIVDINATENHIQRTVRLGGRSFQMAKAENKLFVGGDVVAVFDLENVTQSGLRNLKDSKGNNMQTVDFSKIVTDYQGMLWMLNAGTLYRVNPKTEQNILEMDIYDLKINSWTSCIDISPDKKTIYFNSARRIYKVDVDNPVKPTEPLIYPTGESNRTIYNMCVSPQGTFYYCEVVYGSLSRALIREFDSNAKELNSFKAGLFPHFIHFE